MSVAPAELAQGHALTRREAGLWVTAGAVVLTLHAAFAYVLQGSDPAQPVAEAFEQALEIDLTPLPVTAPDSVASESVSEEEPLDRAEPVEETAELAETAEPPTVTEMRPETVEPAEPEMAEALTPEPDRVAEKATPPGETAQATQTAEPVQPETAEPVEPDPVEPEITQQEIATLVTPEVAIPVPLPRPVVETKLEEPAPKPVAKAAPKAEKPAPKPKKAAAAKAAVAEKTRTAKTEAAPAPKSKASQKSVASKAPTVSPARWQSRVLAWINRHKRYPGGARSRREQGVVAVSFAINASGTVVSARISQSSGNAELDQAALDMVRRASPVPAPPAEIASARMNLALPVEFSLRR